MTSITPDGTLNHDQLFVVQFMHGLREPLSKTQFRLSLTYMSGPPPTASETINICNARRAVGLIEYRSSPEFLNELRKVALNIPVISLSGNMQDDLLGCVACKPDKQLQIMLESRFKKNTGKIIFTSHKSDIISGAYKAIHDAYLKICDKRSLESKVFFSECKKTGTTGMQKTAKDIITQMKLKAGDTVITLSPFMGAKLFEENPGLDIIAYTESSNSVQLYGENISFLYLGIDTIATEGVKLLMATDKKQLPLKKHLKPQILEKNKM